MINTRNRLCSVLRRATQTSADYAKFPHRQSNTLPNYFFQPFSRKYVFSSTISIHQINPTIYGDHVLFEKNIPTQHSEVNSISTTNNAISTIEEAIEMLKQEESYITNLDWNKEDIIQNAVWGVFDARGLGLFIKGLGYKEMGQDYFGKAENYFKEAMNQDARIKDLASKFIQEMDAISSLKAQKRSN